MTVCPHCGQGAVPGQEYCLECGARLPVRSPFGRPRDPGRGWVVRTIVALVVAVAGAAAAIAATGGDDGRPRVLTATGGFATLPSSSTLPAPETGPGGIVDWPAGEDGWTIVLASIPQTRGREVALARVREARKRGLSPVGILDSSRYASLHPGYWLVFAGIYGSEAEATSALGPARRASRTATVRSVVS
jgi:hypothetical protein